jgi:Flp pilus assembly protein TadG
MTWLDRKWEQFENTRPGRVLTRPGLLVAMVFLAIGSSAVAITIALTAISDVASKADARSLATAQEAQAAQTKARELAAAQQRAAGERLRQQFCAVVVFNASPYPPPTTARGVAVEKAWREFGDSTALHCFKK